jgi:Fis family transcriptional regulator
MTSQITHRRAMSPAEELFHVVKTHRSDPLRECVREALSNYFTHLNGHRVSNLYDLVLAEVEGPLLRTVLEHTGGNQTQAAALLGISRSTLRKKLAHYEIG